MKKYIFFVFFLSIWVYFDANQNISNLKKEILKSYTQQNYNDAISKNNALILELKKQNNYSALQSAYENMGVFYSDIYEYKIAMQYYAKALKLVNKNTEKKKYYALILNIGTTLLDANNNNEAINYLEKAKKYFTKFQDKYYDYQICAYTNLAIAYKNKKNLIEALKQNEEALKIAKSNYLLDQFAGPLINMGDIYLEMKEYEKALLFFQDAIFYFQKNQDVLGFWHAKIGIAKIYAQQNRINDAIDIHQKALKYFLKINGYKDLVDCFSNLSTYYVILKDYEKALEYKNKELLYKDLYKNEENMQSISNFKLHYEIEAYNQQLKNKSILIQKEKKITQLLIFSISLVIIIFIFLIQSYRRKQQSLLKKSIENEKIAKKDKDFLTQKLNSTEQELETFALHIIQKNEFIKSTTEELKKLKKANHEEINSLLSNLLIKTNSVFKKNNELEVFLKRVEKVNSNFYQVLSKKFPSLTQKEKKLCALLKLNLSSKDIALLTNVSTGAITMARYRLRTKLNLDTDDNLSEFLINLNSDFE